MEWQALLSRKRLGKQQLEENLFERTSFLKDYDRIVYSTPFRRLKDKTQVFPLSKNADVRTRLIHSLEVSCVGRSLGRMVGDQIIKRHRLTAIEAADFGDILSAACLAHDIGNPPFGHAGEDAIQTAFQKWYARKNRAGALVSPLEKADFDRFEGNAQGFRILTRLGLPHRPGGLQLTCATLATFTKYPRESLIAKQTLARHPGKSLQKYGFFQAEKALFEEVADTVGLIKRSQQFAWWCRHPLTFLMEAADDICYSIVDLEDGFHMGYLPFEIVKDHLQSIANIDLDQYEGSDAETIKRLRAKAINRLVTEVAQLFLDCEPDILAGKFDQSLVGFSQFSQQLKTIEAITTDSVFHHPNVVRIKIGGFEVLGDLLTEFLTAVLEKNPRPKSKLLKFMLPTEFQVSEADSHYEKILKVTDYIAGMTDLQATLLYQQLRGITI
ncbi:MAG: deoxyguanosinetriphosphate triphosphohydrolase [Synechocystis sp.]|nr:deoxyguanosinetriphosphate triphosphohydrolase [Synechocystis sp.]